MGLRGEIKLTGAEGPQTMLVFDDGVIVGEPSKAGRAGFVFGGIGGMLGGLASEVSGRRLAKAIADVVSALPEPSAEAIASQVKRARLFRIDEVSTIRLEKGRGKTRKLMIVTTDGKHTVYRFGIPMQPEAPVSDLLGALFGARFHDAVGTSR